LPEKLKFIGLTRKILLQDEVDFGGYKQLFEDFYFEVRKEVANHLKDATDETALDSFVLRISEYVMRKLHTTIWNRETLTSADDETYRDRARTLSWIQPE